MNNIEEIKQKIKNKRGIYQKTKTSPSYKVLYIFLIKTLILLLIGLSILIFIKKDESNKQILYNTVFEENISFSKIKGIYNKYLGGIMPFDNIMKMEVPVFKEQLKYKSIHKYKDGVSLIVEEKYLIPVKQDGIVTFIGQKEGYNKTVIVESEDVEIWYGNLDNVSVSLYDYVSKGTFLGDTIDDRLFLVFKKDGKIVDYKKYI